MSQATAEAEALSGNKVLLMLKNPDRFRILLLIADGGSVSVLDLARRLRVAPTSVYQHVKRLEQFGWIGSFQQKGFVARHYACASPELRDVVLQLRTLTLDPATNAALASRPRTTPWRP